MMVNQQRMHQLLLPYRLNLPLHCRLLSRRPSLPSHYRLLPRRLNRLLHRQAVIHRQPS